MPILSARPAQSKRGHGRIEIRQCWAIADLDILRQLRRATDWPNLQAVVVVQAERRIGAESTSRSRYFLNSLTAQAKALLQAIRTHWSIENGLHWVLDIAFREDDSRIRKDLGPENFAILRHIALNLLKQETTTKASIKGKRLKAGWDESYLLHLLRG